MTEKIVSDRTFKMTVLGKKIWKEMCGYCGMNAITHPLEYFADSVLPLGSKTLKRRLDDDQWQINDLIALQQTLKSDDLHNYIISKFAEAMK